MQITKWQPAEAISPDQAAKTDGRHRSVQLLRAVDDTSKHPEDFIMAQQALRVFPIQADGTPPLTTMFPGTLHHSPIRSNNSRRAPPPPDRDGQPNSCPFNRPSTIVLEFQL